MFLNKKHKKFREGNNKRGDWNDRPTWYEVQECAVSAG
jgi:hypothetical protein